MMYFQNLLQPVRGTLKIFNALPDGLLPDSHQFRYHSRSHSVLKVVFAFKG